MLAVASSTMSVFRVMTSYKDKLNCASFILAGHASKEDRTAPYSRLDGLTTPE